jgi:hypothetical protein
MGGVDGTYGIEKKCTQALMRRHEGKRPFERRRCRWKDIEMYLHETGWEDVNRIDLAQDDPL